MTSIAQQNRPFICLWNEAVRKCKDLHISTKGLLYTLATYANSDGSSCFPSLETLAEDCGVSIRTISKHMKKAREAGFIRNQRRQTGLRRLSNLKELLIPKGNKESVEAVQKGVKAKSKVKKSKAMTKEMRSAQKKQTERFLLLWMKFLSSKMPPSKTKLGESSYEENSTALAWMIHRMMQKRKPKIDNVAGYFVSVVDGLKYHKEPVYAFEVRDIVRLIDGETNPYELIKNVKA